MKSLKQIINRYIRSAAIVMTLVILVVIAFAEILIEQGRVKTPLPVRLYTWSRLSKKMRMS